LRGAGGFLGQNEAAKVDHPLCRLKLTAPDTAGWMVASWFIDGWPGLLDAGSRI
jgi:hypothetical protein